MLLNKFEVIRPLGYGRFGEVHHVINRPVGRSAAIKIIEVTDPTTQRAVIEAQAQTYAPTTTLCKFTGRT
ncbi:hypothetical protein [Microvirga ossetica]|uniref:hypothetical protein n=1 Tax=Microvirga ossetica TaxID=1882682 RepID=UPI0012FFDAF8|nr:hypothetical protein [Microvirga ossetica]